MDQDLHLPRSSWVGAKTIDPASTSRPVRLRVSPCYAWQVCSKGAGRREVLPDGRQERIHRAGQSLRSENMKFSGMKNSKVVATCANRFASTPAIMQLFRWCKPACYARPIIAACSFQAIDILPSSESRLRSGATCPFKIASIAAGPRRAKGRILLTYAT
jgi:hypothetical protein